MSKKKNQTRWYDYVFHLLAFVLALLFFATGGTKLIDFSSHVASFAQWGYPAWFMYLIGGIEVISALFLIFPLTRYYGATLIVFVMIGAIFTHIQAGEWSFVGVSVLILLFALLISIRRTFEINGRPIY